MKNWFDCLRGEHIGNAELLFQYFELDDSSSARRIVESKHQYSKIPMQILKSAYCGTFQCFVEPLATFPDDSDLLLYSYCSNIAFKKDPKIVKYTTMSQW